MRVLHVYKDFYPVVGGIENHLMLLTRELSNLPGVDVEVLVTSPRAQTTVEWFDRVKVIKAARLCTVASTPISPALFREIRGRDYDIIHLHFPYPVGEIAALWRGRAKRLVLTYHSDIVRQKSILRLYHPLLLKLLNTVNAIIVGSANYIDTSPYLGRFRHKCEVIPLGTDVSRFEQSIDEGVQNSLRAKYRPPFVLFVGKFRYYKGLHYLLEAMPHVRGCTLLLVGRGPEEANLRAQVKRLGLEDRVVFLGHVAENLLPSYYHASEVFVLPSCERAEAFGMVQVEAMACGLPVVSTDVGTGTTYVNLHGTTGLVVPPANPPALAEALNRLMENKPLRQAMGRAGHDRVASDFTKELMVQRTVSLYRRVLEA